MPVGSLSSSHTLVDVGDKPDLTWNITYPAVIKELVTITTPGTLTPKVKVAMDVRVIGASVKTVWLNSWGVVTRWEWTPTECQLKLGNGSYSRIFYNTQNNVNPNSIVYSNSGINIGTNINFAGRYNLSGNWSTLFTSTSGGANVVALANGDTPPTTTPMYQQPTVEDFIKPYLDSNGKIKIGPMDVIYLMELTHTNKYDAGFDLQDLCLLVTFRKVN